MINSLYYVALRYDYGELAKGFSYEHDNMEIDIETYCSEHGIEFTTFNPDVPGDMDKLRAAPKADAIFHVAFNDSLDLPLDIAQAYIAEGRKVIQWDCDSSYRFHNWIWPRRNRVTHFITTHNDTVPWYQMNNMKVIKSQWAAASSHYYMSSIPKEFDVSFIGQKHGIRPQIMAALRSAGINVNIWGDFWEPETPFFYGRLRDVNEVVKIINMTKINLNLQNPWMPGTPTQIKGRIMQIPACKGFQLATPADNINEYFTIDKEIVIANDVNELIAKISYYLQHNDEREQIAQAAYDRCKRDHTWSNRMDALLKELI